MTETIERDAPEGDVCDRCGDCGADRRTLWHASGYAMEETGVPYRQFAVHGKTHERTGTKEFWFHEEDRKAGYKPHTVPVYSEEPTGEIKGRGFYTLRVCKACRSSWMESLRNWFFQKPVPTTSTGTGVFGRQWGRTYELTEEECVAKWGENWRGEDA